MQLSLASSKTRAHFRYGLPSSELHTSPICRSQYHTLRRALAGDSLGLVLGARGLQRLSGVWGTAGEHAERGRPALRGLAVCHWGPVSTQEGPVGFRTRVRLRRLSEL